MKETLAFLGVPWLSQTAQAKQINAWNAQSLPT
jgi:hypothetical protein